VPKKLYHTYRVSLHHCPTGLRSDELVSVISIASRPLACATAFSFDLVGCLPPSVAWSWTVMDSEPPRTSGADGDFRWCLPLLILGRCRSLKWCSNGTGHPPERAVMPTLPWGFQQRGRNVHLLKSAHIQFILLVFQDHALYTGLGPRTVIVC